MKRNESKALTPKKGAIAQSYDNLLMAQFFGLPAFQKDFGHAVKGKKGQYQLTSAWQAGLSE